MASAFDPHVLASLQRRLGQFRPDAERQWGRMTPHNAVMHLRDSFGMALGDRPIPDRSTLVLRTVGRWVAFHTPLRWPQGVAAPRELDQAQDGSTPSEWDSDLAALREALDRFAGDPSRMDGSVHALFGPLTRREWGTWGHRHTDHHLRQFGL